MRVCNYLCALVGRRWRGGDGGGGGGVVCTRQCVHMLVNLNLNVYVYLRVDLLQEHCSVTQSVPLTFQLHLSVRNKGLSPRL